MQSLGAWTLRDYAKRVWDNAGEDNIFFLAGGIAFNILLAAVPFVLLLVSRPRTLLNTRRTDVTESRRSLIACCRRTRRDREPASTSCSSTSPRARRRWRLQRGRVHLVLDAPVRVAADVLADVFDIETDRGIIAGQAVRHPDHDHRRRCCSSRTRR